MTAYQSILSESTREALGIELEGKTLIFDEAHNLMDSITQINSVDLHSQRVIQAYDSIKEYGEKYKSRMLPKNIKMIACSYIIRNEREVVVMIRFSM